MELEQTVVETKSKRGQKREHNVSPEAGNQSTRSRRTKPLPGLTRKLAELAGQAVETALKEEARNAEEHARVRALFNVVLSGAVTTLLKNSSLLTEDDRTFLRELGYLPKAPKEAV